MKGEADWRLERKGRRKNRGEWAENLGSGRWFMGVREFWEAG